MGILGSYDQDGTYHPPFDEDGNYIPQTRYVQTTEDMAKQEFKEECDINRIVDRFAQSGLVTHLARGVPQFADVSEMGDYRSAIETVREAQEFFMGLPAKVRAEFNNDPAQLLDAAHNPEYWDRLIELGILEAAESPHAPPTPPPAAPAPPAPPEPALPAPPPAPTPPA